LRSCIVVGIRYKVIVVRSTHKGGRMADDKKTAQAAHWTDADFKKNVEDAKEAGMPVFVDFYAEWCGPCQMAAPIVDKLAGEYEGKVHIVKVNVDENNQVPASFGVMSIPTVVIIKDGELAAQKVGFPGEQGYRDMIEKVLE